MIYLLNLIKWDRHYLFCPHTPGEKILTAKVSLLVNIIMSHFITKIIRIKYKNLFSKDCLCKKIKMREYFQKENAKSFYKYGGPNKSTMVLWWLKSKINNCKSWLKCLMHQSLLRNIFLNHYSVGTSIRWVEVIWEFGNYTQGLF